MSSEKLKIISEWAGETPYNEGLVLQNECAELVLESTQNLGRPISFVLGLEHPSVITLGRRANPSDHVLATPESLAQKGIELTETSRGGHATLHSPGQLVIYPIVPIGALQIGVREFVSVLEAATIQTLKFWGVESFTSGSDPGVFTKKGKIAFIGIRVERGVTSHGVAINVSNDVGLFGAIRSCNVAPGKAAFDQLRTYQLAVTTHQVFEVWVGALRERLTFKAPTTRFSGVEAEL